MLIKNEKWYSVFVVSDVAFYQYVLILERGEMAAAYTLLKIYLLLTVQKMLFPLDFICWHVKKVISPWLIKKSCLPLTSFVDILKKLSTLDCSFVDILKRLSPLDFSFINILKKLSPLHCSFVDILKNEVVEYNKEG